MTRPFRWVTVLAVLAVLAVLTVNFSRCLRPARPPRTIVLNDEDVESVIAEVFKVDGVRRGAPATDVPAEYIPQILEALRPVVVCDYPSQWDEWTLAKLTIKKRDRTIVEIFVPMCGQNPLCFKYNGLRCIRGGSYEPVLDIVHEGIRLGYGDESVTLAYVLEEIHLEATTGRKSENLADSLQDLERSAGRRPPRKLGRTKP